MSQKDVGKGWGDLNGSLKNWHCPKCNENFQIQDWPIINSVINGVQMDGRKCPKCEFSAYQHHETIAMQPQ